jgi:hypothetical protein
MKITDFGDVRKVLEDFEKRILRLEGKKAPKQAAVKREAWYKPGSTVDKIIQLIGTGFFNKHRTIADLVTEFKTRDYHLKPSDLTLPLRKIVRKALLNKTKTNSDGTRSSKWLYVKA